MPQVRALASARLDRLQKTLEETEPESVNERAHRLALASDIVRFLSRDATRESQPARPQAPPGAPIGEPEMRWLAAAPQVCDSP